MEYNKHLYESVKNLAQRYEELTKQVDDPSLPFEEVKRINKQIKKHGEVVQKFYEYDTLIDNAKQAEEILNDLSIKDKDFIDMAKIDLEDIKSKIPSIEEEIKVLLLPVDPNNDKNVIIEMRPAAGGDESSIFVSNLFDAYQRYAIKQG